MYINNFVMQVLDGKTETIPTLADYLDEHFQNPDIFFLAKALRDNKYSLSTFIDIIMKCSDKKPKRKLEKC